MRDWWLVWLIVVGMAGLSCAYGAGDAIFPEKDKSEKEEDKDKDPGIARTMERFDKTLGWLRPTRTQLKTDLEEATKGQKAKEVTRLKKEIARYDIYVRALMRLRRYINEAASEGNMAKFKRFKRVADKLLDLFDAWQEAEEKEKTDEAKRARREVERYIKRYNLDKPPKAGEFPEDLEDRIDSGEFGDPAQRRRDLQRLRDFLNRRRGGRRRR